MIMSVANMKCTRSPLTFVVVVIPRSRLGIADLLELRITEEELRGTCADDTESSFETTIISDSEVAENELLPKQKELPSNTSRLNFLKIKSEKSFVGLFLGL